MSTADQTVGIGAYAGDGGITAAKYIHVIYRGLSQNQYDTQTTKDGYFTYSLSDCTVWVKDPAYTPKYTVTFAPDGGIPAPAAQSVSAGSVAAAPPDMVKTGYLFDGWYETSDYSGAPYSFAPPVNANLTLYAKWSPDVVSGINGSIAGRVRTVSVEGVTADKRLLVQSKVIGVGGKDGLISFCLSNRQEIR